MLMMAVATRNEWVASLFLLLCYFYIWNNENNRRL